MKYDKFGKRLKQALDKNNLEESKLADKLNITRQTVYNWTSGKSVPGYDTLMELSKILKISLDYLMRGVTSTSVVDDTGLSRPLIGTLRSVYSSIHFDTLTQTLTGDNPVGEHFYYGELKDNHLLLNVNSSNLSGSDPSNSINKGDIIVIDTLRNPRPGDFVLTIFDDFSSDIYQYFPNLDQVILRSFYPNTPDYTVDFSTVRKFFSLVEVIPRSRKLI